ncbi:class I SAM-dependent methyltransferase [Ignatzschineria cameli]|uniref:class I SAM-dependent methyltransferase n=1 Tax=Ignatzschineria cameli TaxID=2182793 RepID=UPI000D61D39F|nr:class I SAM-dependent methyltransferase [Ignatzschineria cameli]PWD87531.1 SAM-dependent methyltransferase [Ignatzschineria cameli]
MDKVMMIDEIDFGALYRQHAKASLRRPKTAEDWDARAEKLALEGECSNEDYREQFLNKMTLKDIKSVLDVGCGSGTIALAVAPYVERVYALDHSPKMLALLEEKAKSAGIDNIETILLSWEDDWGDVPICDIALSSRSSMVSDLEAALEKLNSKAKRAVYMTMTMRQGYLNRELLDLLEREYIGFPTYIYALNILYQQGYSVSVDFITADHRRPRQAPSLMEFIEAVNHTLGSLSPLERIRVEDYYLANEHRLLQLYYDIRPWAFLHWERS